MTEPLLPDSVARNQTSWTDAASEFAGYAVHAWESEPEWGIWGIPESELSLLPRDLAGKDAPGGRVRDGVRLCLVVPARRPPDRDRPDPGSARHRPEDAGRAPA